MAVLWLMVAMLAMILLSGLVLLLDSPGGAPEERKEARPPVLRQESGKEKNSEKYPLTRGGGCDKIYKLSRDGLRKKSQKQSGHGPAAAP